MHRGATARTVLSVLAVVLVALQLQLLIPTTSFASAHTTRQAMTEVQSGTKPSAKVVRHGIVICQDVEKLGNPTSRSRTRNRQRHADIPAVSQPALSVSLTSAETEATRSAADSVHDRTSIPPRVHTPTALQVVRC